MKKINIYLNVAVLLVGVIVGFFVKNFPIIVWKNEVKIFEVLQWITTALIGLLIPFAIKKLIDDNRQIKQVLIDDFKGLIVELKKIKDKLESSYQVGSVGAKDKDAINMLFSDVDIKMSNLNDLFLIAFPKNSLIFETTNTEYIKYWKGVTGGQLMSSSYTVIDEQFFRDQNLNFGALEKEIKIAIIKLNKL